MINVPTRDEWDQLLICQEFAGYQKLVCSMDEHVGQKHQELRRELDNIAARLTDAEERDAFKTIVSRSTSNSSTLNVS